MPNYSVTVAVLKKDDIFGKKRRSVGGVMEARMIVEKGVEMGVPLWYEKGLSGDYVVSRRNWSIEKVQNLLEKEHTISRDKPRAKARPKKQSKWGRVYDASLCAIVKL